MKWKNLENFQPGHVKSKKACLREQTKDAAKWPFAKDITMDRRKPGTIHQDKLKGISKIFKPAPPIISQEL